MSNQSARFPFAKGNRRTRLAKQLSRQYGTPRAAGATTLASAALLSLVIQQGKANAVQVYGSPRKQAKQPGGYLVTQKAKPAFLSVAEGLTQTRASIELTAGMALKSSSVSSGSPTRPLGTACDATVTSTADNGAGSLREAIYAGNFNGASETVCFDAALDGQTITLNNQINVYGGLDDGLTLYGRNQITLSGGNSTRMLNISDGFQSLTLNGMSFTGGYASDPRYGGGAVLVRNNTALNISNTTFSGNTTFAQRRYYEKANTGDAQTKGSCYYYYSYNYCYGGRNNSSGSGGAVLQGSGGSLAVNNSFFTYNSSTSPSYYYKGRGGAQGVGGAIATNSNTTVTNTVFSNNSSSRSGGALVVSGTSGYYYYGPPKIGNDSDTKGVCYYGCARAPVTLSVSGSTISNNYARFGAGGLYSSSGPYGSLTLTTNTFSTNTTRYGSGGGAVLRGIQSSVSVSGGSFTGNSAGSDGGGLYIRGQGTGTSMVSNVTFGGNSAYNDGGGLSIAGRARNTLTVSNNTLTGNSASSDGGGFALDIRNSEATASDNMITGNYAYDDGGGAYLDSYYSTLTLQRNTVQTNQSGDGNGGGFAMEVDRSTATISNSTFSGNRAYNDGGALYLDSYASTVNVNDTQVIGNSADYGSGGGVVIYGDGAYSSSLNVTRSTIDGNSAEYSGGGFYASGGPVINVLYSTVSNNTATYGGGGAILDRSDVNLIQSTVSGNNASSRGGGVYSDSSVFGFYATIANNSSPAGAGLHINGGRADLFNSIVSGNGPADTYGSVYSTFSLVGTPGGGTVTDLGGSIVGTPAALGPLANNGGPTLTQLPLAGSAVLGAGSGTAGPNTFANDQRGGGFPRQTGGVPDMGAANSGLIPAGPPAAAAVPIPTLSAVGSWLMALMMGVAGYLGFRRRRNED